MRVILVGTAAARRRLHAALASGRLAAGSPADRQGGAVEVIEIVAEFETLRAAQAAGAEEGALVLATHAEPAAPAGEHWIDEPLTPREIDVLELMAEGLPNKGIATRLGISDQTVKFHVAAILGKLGASNRTDAVRRALRRGVITL